MRGFCLALIWLAGAQAQPARLNGNGVIEGRLTGEGGTKIAGASVHLRRLPPFPKRPGQTEWSAVTDSDGGFKFSRLFDGSYQLCSQALSGAWLNPCQWGLDYPLVTISESQPVAGISIVLKKGAVAPIRVEDPGQRLSQHEGKTPGAHLLIGVGNDAFAFMPARLVAADSSGKSLEIVIPFNSRRNLVVRSAFFQLADGLGLPLANARATMIPLVAVGGQKPAELRLRVTGAARP
jgi:hypothetical protein